VALARRAIWLPIMTRAREQKVDMTEADQRPPIPMQLQRQLKVEAGHRCAIPTCRQTPVELAHIVPWSQVREHTFENMITLCPTCHARFDRGEIDRTAMRQYKANLTVIASRYGDLERRVLTIFAENPNAEEVSVPGHLHILMSYMVVDGLVVLQPVKTSLAIKVDGEDITLYPPLIYRITPKGKEFVQKWLSAQELD